MNRMRELRKSINLTMKQLGEMIGVSESTISFYETGRHEPDLKTICSIADILGTSIDYLLGHETNINSQNSIQENEIVKLFKSLNEEGKETAMNTMRALAAYDELSIKSEPVKEVV